MSVFVGQGWDPGGVQPLWSPPPCVTVSVQDIELVSGLRGPVGMTLGRWDGWINGTTARGGPVPWETADGGIEGDVWSDGRQIRLEGLIKARDATELWEQMETLGSVFTRPRWDWLRVDEEHLGLSRQIRVTRLARPMITPVSNRLATYTLELQSAGFPRLDQSEQSAVIPSGGVDLINAGNHPAAVTATLRGPLTNPGLSWTGQSWTYQGSVASGQEIRVEMWRRKVLDVATSRHSRSRAVATAHGWLALPPGATRVSRTGSGSGTVTLEWRSTWA